MTECCAPFWKLAAFDPDCAWAVGARPLLRAKDKWGMHVEVVTNIIPGMNDDDEQIYALACWIAENLGELTI